jgi:hypothetical protein
MRVRWRRPTVATWSSWLNGPIEPRFRTIEGLAIRFAGEDRDDHALLLTRRISVTTVRTLNARARERGPATTSPHAELGRRTGDYRAASSARRRLAGHRSSAVNDRRIDRVAERQRQSWRSRSTAVRAWPHSPTTRSLTRGNSPALRLALSEERGDAAVSSETRPPRLLLFLDPGRSSRSHRHSARPRPRLVARSFRHASDRPHDRTRFRVGTHIPDQSSPVALCAGGEARPALERPGASALLAHEGASLPHLRRLPCSPRKARQASASQRCVSQQAVSGCRRTIRESQRFR